MENRFPGHRTADEPLLWCFSRANPALALGTLSLVLALPWATVWSWVSHLAFLRVTMSFSVHWGPDPPHQSTTSPWPQYWTQGQTLPGTSAGKTSPLIMLWVPKILIIEYKPGTAGNHFCHHTERTRLGKESARRWQPRRTRQQCD